MSSGENALGGEKFPPITEVQKKTLVALNSLALSCQSAKNISQLLECFDNDSTRTILLTFSGKVANTRDEKIQATHEIVDNSYFYNDSFCGVAAKRLQDILRNKLEEFKV